MVNQSPEPSFFLTFDPQDGDKGYILHNLHEFMERIPLWEAARKNFKPHSAEKGVLCCVERREMEEQYHAVVTYLLERAQQLKRFGRLLKMRV
jgi:hypothetical protein